MFGFNKDIIQVTLLSVLMIFVPMFYFPARFGLDLVSGSMTTYMMFEIFFYGIIFYAFRPKSSLLQLFAGAGLTFLYRILIGSIFGFLLSVFYNMDLSVCLALGVSRYLPAILLHVAAAPFIMRVFYINIYNQTASKKAPGKVDIKPVKISVSRGVRPTPQPTDPPQKKTAESTTVPMSSASEEKETSMLSSHMVGQGVNGFDRAVSYIGEHHAVMIAAVVDHEGLTMATFKRQGFDVDIWAPYALLIKSSNQDLINRFDDGRSLSEIEMSFGGKRLTITKAGQLSLVVLANREEDDLLNIRIAQGAEIIKKYMSDRYGKLMSESTEEQQYVSDTGRA